MTEVGIAIELLVSQMADLLDDTLGPVVRCAGEVDDDEADIYRQRRNKSSGANDAIARPRRQAWTIRVQASTRRWVAGLLQLLITKHCSCWSRPR